jgi:hypothetical protein
MKKLLIISTAIFLSLYSCICFDRVGIMHIVNNSNTGQIVCITCADSIGSEMDSLTNNPYFKQFDSFKSEIVNTDSYIDSNNTARHRVGGGRESIVRRCKDKHARFFFISDSVFMNNPWDTIVKYQMYNRKLVFSEKELKENNWVVVYE